MNGIKHEKIASEVITPSDMKFQLNLVFLDAILKKQQKGIELTAYELQNICQCISCFEKDALEWRPDNLGLKTCLLFLDRLLGWKKVSGSLPPRIKKSLCNGCGALMRSISSMKDHALLMNCLLKEATTDATFSRSPGAFKDLSEAEIIFNMISTVAHLSETCMISILEQLVVCISKNVTFLSLGEANRKKKDLIEEQLVFEVLGHLIITFLNVLRNYPPAGRGGYCHLLNLSI
eukprot:Nk52_evm3s316 gene=Nk52_evmTU3s316